MIFTLIFWALEINDLQSRNLAPGLQLHFHGTKEKQNKWELAGVAYVQPGETQLERDFNWLAPVCGEDIPGRWNSSDNASELR
jgi:hypothetical protein